jgi:transposase
MPPATGRKHRTSHLQTVPATVPAITALAAELKAAGVQVVSMEATFDYWRIWFAVLEEAGLAVQLVSSSQAGNLPGRPKTGKGGRAVDRAADRDGDAAVLVRAAAADPGAAGLHRHIWDLTADRTRYWQRLEKLLEDALCKLTSVVSRLAGHQTARAVIEAMIAGERDPRVLAALGQVTEHLAAIPGSWGVDSDGTTGPGAGRASGAAALPAAERLDEIPGLGREAAMALIAEIGLDMSRFPTPQALVSWAGLTPTARQSGPRKGRGKKGHGNTYAKRIAVLAAYAAANTDTFLGERFRRLASRPGGGGRKKAGCAVGRSILIIVWHLLNDPAARYRDLGPDWHARHTDRSRKARNARRQLEALGYDVIITLREDARLNRLRR